MADEATISVIPNPTPVLLRKLEARRRVWAAQNSTLEALREEQDTDFKSEEDPRDLNHYVPKDQEKAFYAFLSDNDAEDKRLIADRKAEVEELVSQYVTKEPKMSVNSFRPKKFEDFEIVDEGNKVFGHIRVKPSGVLWAPTNAKVWYGVSLKDFSAFMEQHGKKQVK